MQQLLTLIQVNHYGQGDRARQQHGQLIAGLAHLEDGFRLPLGDHLHFDYIDRLEQVTIWAAVEELFYTWIIYVACSGCWAPAN